MYSAEVLSQLRSLNWTLEEARRVPAESAEGTHIRDQIAGLRERLPNSILLYHDRLAAAGRASTAEVSHAVCGACHIKVPPSLVGELTVPGRFAVCPSCGVFLWSAANRETSVAPSDRNAAKRSSRRVEA